MNATGTFKGQQAPCGRIVDGETYQDQDDEAEDREPVAEESPSRERPLAASLDLETALVGEARVRPSGHTDGRSDEPGVPVERMISHI